MRYDDASQASSANAEPIARADTEVLPQGSFGPATGNAISGAGTTSGANGADSVGAAPATIAAVQGSGGATGQAAGSFHAIGQYGVLSMDAEGNFSYVRNPGTPDGVQDVFQYTLADAAGAQSSTTLTIDIAQVAAAQAGQGIVNLPAGVEMSDIHVNGRDLVIDMPDGTQMVIPGGAVFVPQLAIGDVEVPATNLAALLINSEPQPAAGTPQSSGGNFAVDVPPLDPGVPLGDLIPPTELSYSPPEFEELANAIDHKPTVVIITPDNPAGAVDAVANVDESGLPARGSEPEGTLASQDIESTSGTIVFVAEDGVDSITVGGVEVTSVNQVINGAHGILTITSIDLASGQIGFSYTATDNTTDGVDDFEDFAVVVTDADGDVASGNLHINIADDEPIALDDTDTLDVDTLTATGNVMTGANTTSGASGKDTVGADDASLTAVSGADGSDSSFNSDGNLVVHGAYGTLTIDAHGQYTYVLDDNAPDNVKDVFTYTLTDSDGDNETATLTITIPNINEPPVVETSAVNVSEEGLAGGNPDTSGSPDTTNSKTASGDIGLTDPDGDATTVTLGVPAGSYTSGGEAVHWAVSADGHSLVGYTGADSASNHVIEISINNAGEYTVTLVQPFDDPNVAIEDSIAFTVPVSVNDGAETVSTSITVTVEDDAPNAVNDTDSVSGNTAVGNVVSGVGTTNGGADSYGGDGPGSVTGIHAGTSGSFTAVPQDGGDVLVHGSFGDLVIHDDGSYTYTRSPNSVTGGTDVFTYQLTDGDGDTDTATLTITVPNINTTPSIGDVDDAVVDEDGLQNANVDANPLQVDPDETDSTQDASFEGQIHVDFKSDVPANLGTAITLVDTDALDDQLQTLDGKDIVFELESGVLVGRPEGGGDALITISITGVTAGSGGNATYTYEVNLLGPVQHAGGTELTSAEDSVSLEGVTFTITDSNNDHATGTFDVTIVDDVPTAALSGEGAPSITLDESAAGTDSSDGTLPNGIASDTVDFSGAFAAPVFGADGEGSVGYEVHVTGSNVGSGLYALQAGDTSTVDGDGYGQGDEIMLVDNGDGTVSGMIGSTEYFVISVNSSGEVTFTQLANIWHPDVTNNDESVSILPDGGVLSLVQTITDGDGDTDSASVDLSGAFSIQDDGPQPFDGCPDEVNAVNGNGPETDPISLNLPDPGTDLPFVLSFGDIQDGDPVVDNGGHQLSSGGQLLYYSVNESDPTILEARTDPDPGEGTLVFQIDLNSVDGTYTFHQFEPISSETELSIQNLSSIGGGNVDARAIDVADSPYDLVLTTKSGDTVNTNATQIGISDGNSFESGEILRVDLVQNTFVTGSGPSAVLNYGEYYTANSYQQDVIVNGSGNTASFTVKALAAVEAGGSDPSDPADGDDTFYNDGNDTVVTDTSITIYDDTGVEVTDPAGAGITVTDLGGGVWQIEGLPDGYDFKISSDTSFNAVQIEAIDGTDQFKLGFINLTAVVQGDVDLTVPITLTDADGDPVSCDIDINLTPGASGANVILQVNEAGLDGIGSDGLSDSETNGGDLGGVVSGGTAPYSFVLTGSNSDGDSPYGHLTLNTDGTYTFTLEHPVDGSTADNGTNVVGGVVTYTYEATDSLGATTTGSITIDVRDDVPTARADTDVITEGDANEQGNVITGDGTTNVGDSGDDTKGADGATVTGATGYLGAVGTVDGDGNVTVTGQWGTLVIHPDGSYTYTLSTEGAAALEAKGEGQTLTDEVFTYTLTDGDGDTDTATLTITPTGTNDNPGVIVPDSEGDTKTVYEAGLDERSGEPAGTAEAADGDGTNNDVGTETVTGSFTFSDGDGDSTVTINGTPIDLDGPFPLLPIAGAYGDLTITSVVGHTINYSYTLSDNIDHSDLAADQDDFAIVVDDSDGSNADAASDTLTIHIADDAPIADNDTDVIDQGDTSETGNVITGAGTTSGDTGDDRVGADNAEVTAVSHPTGGAGTVDGDGNITVDGLWGTLVIEPDGDYTYTLSTAGTNALNALGEGQSLTAEVFTYTLTDGDDSTDTATLTITPMGANDNPDVNVPDTGDDTKTVYEAGLAERTGEPAGTDEAADGDGTDDDVTTETVTGTFTFTDGDGASTVTINGTTIDLDGPFPLAPIAGAFGDLTITNVVGHTVSYSYTLSDNISHNDGVANQDDFTIVVDDSDGSPADAASDTLTIHIADDTPIADNDTDALVEGETSQSGNVITGVGTTSLSAGDDRVGADNASVTAATGFGGAGTVDGDGNVTVTGQWGTIVIQPDGDYTYTLSSAGIAALEAKGAGQTLTAEVVTYTLTDTDGSTDTATLTISLTGTDDTPGLTVPDTGPDTKTVDEAGLPTRTGELAGTGEAADSNPSNDNSEIVTGTFTFTAGDGATVITIDGAGAGGPVTIPLGGPFPTAAIVGSYGSLVVTGVSGGTVSYRYTLTDNVNHTTTPNPVDDFTITVDDSDGSTADKVTDTLSIHITDDTPLNFQPDTAVAENTGTDVVTGSLDDDGTLANDGGADSIASLTWNVGANGTILLDTDGHHVTAGGQDVKLYVEADGSLTATTDHSSAAATVFTATLDASGSSYEIDFDRALDNGSTSASNFEGAKAGNNQWIGIDPDLVGGKTIDIASASDPNPDSTDLLVTGFNHTSRAAITVNRDSDDIGGGSGQANGPNETLRIDFVQDLTRDPLVDESTAGGYNFDTHIGEKVFSFTMVNPKAHGDTSVLLEAFNTTNETTSKGDVHALANNTSVELDPDSIVVKLGNTVLVEGTDYDVYASDIGDGVYVSGIPEGAVIQVQAIGGATFEAIEITNAAGHHIPGEAAGIRFSGADFGIGGFSYGVNDPGDPVAFNLPVTLTDGDGDTSSGTVPVTVYPVGQAPSNLMALNSVTTQGFKTALAPSNDNSGSNNAALLGAVAAAGLVASQDVAAHSVDHGARHAEHLAAKAEQHEFRIEAASHHERGGRGGDQLDARSAGHHDEVLSKTAVHHDDVQSLQHATEHQQKAPAELLQATSAPVHGHDTAHAAVTAAAIAMPSAEQLAAVSGAAAPQGQHDQVVGKVLADALHGRAGHGPDLDALINSLPGHGHGHGADLAALASHAEGHVPHGHSAFAGAFSAGQNMLTMDHMAAHHDAPPPHA